MRSPSDEEEVVLGAPVLTTDDDSVLSVEVVEAPHADLRVRAGSGGVKVRLQCTCLRPGVTTMRMQIPVAGYCTISVSWAKHCSKEAIVILPRGTQNRVPLL